MELNTSREITYLQATMYYFVCYLNTVLTRRSRLYSRFKNETRCNSFMALNKRNFSRVEIRFFSLVEIPIKHSSYNKQQSEILRQSDPALLFD